MKVPTAQTIEEAFKAYATGLPAGLSDEALSEIRSAFFAGTHIMFYTAREMATWPMEAVKLQMQNIELELMVFASQLPGAEGHAIQLPKC